jgi:hypothetical protein
LSRVASVTRGEFAGGVFPGFSADAAVVRFPPGDYAAIDDPSARSKPLYPR